MTLDYVYLEVIVAVVFLPLFARGFLLNGNITTNSPDFQRNPTVAAVAPTKNVPVTLYVNISSTSSLVCEDTIDTCSQYGRTPCTEKTYEAWAKSHCALYCGLCTPPISANQLCENKLSNCAEFDSGNLCTDDRYYTWAYDNCKGYCKFDICNDSWCDDSKGVNCPLLDSAINLCSDIPKAKSICRKYCNLCNVTDGKWCSWGPWNNCDVTCGNGTQVRTRQCACPKPQNGGSDCVGDIEKSTTCSLNRCPVHGGWSTWSDWGTCSTSCGIGLRRRDRHCNNPYPSLFGDHCFGENINYDVCADHMCTSGKWTEWAEWDACSVTCGVGLRRRERNCTVSSLLLQTCTGDSFEIEICPTIDCPAVRLVNGANTYEGRVEVNHKGEWGTVCNDGFGTEEARVVCRMLNLPWDSGYAYTDSNFGQGTLPILLDDVVCSGSEMSLEDCSHRSWGTNNCGIGDEVGVSCKPNLHIRLVGGSTSHRGRLEVNIDGSHWGTVCDDRFNNNAAKVVCRMLGYPTSNARYNASVSRGTGPIFLDEVNCTGSETSLLLCKHNLWGDDDCHHDEDVGVVCA